MRSQEKRIQKLEKITVSDNKDVPTNLNELYALMDDPESDVHKELEALYDPNRGRRKP